MGCGISLPWPKQPREPHPARRTGVDPPRAGPRSRHEQRDIFVGEVIGTAILILFGAGVRAAVTLRYSKARASGWIVIAFRWEFAWIPVVGPLAGGAGLSYDVAY